MPTTPLPRRAGLRIAAVTALTAALTPLSGVPTAGAQENATIKIHTAPWDGVARTPYGDAIDEPRVCRFYLDAVNFEEVTTATYRIAAEPRPAELPGSPGPSTSRMAPATPWT